MSGFAAWSRKALTNPTIWSKPKPTTRVTVRLMAGLAGQHTVKIQPGDPDASTGINRTSITFPEPFDDSGIPTTACRDFIVRTIRDAVRRDRRSRWIEWMDGSSTAFTPDSLIPVSRPCCNHPPR